MPTDDPKGRRRFAKKKIEQNESKSGALLT